MTPRCQRRASVGGLLLGWLLGAANGHSAGVTLVTHGFNGNVTDWVIPMVGAMAASDRLPGTNSSCYEISFTTNGQGGFIAVAQRIGGVAPLAGDSGEIFIKLDWSDYATGSHSTLEIASWTVPALLDPNFIPELGGRALAELPLHLIGHSRGASVMSEVSRLLGTQGVWVDHLTSLDPVPVDPFGDPAVRSYANVFFADNFWQNIGGFLVPTGTAISGAYNRQLTNLSGGYSSPHSDVHLWYHATIDLATPVSDTQASIGASQRTAWWTPVEAMGASNGFFLSLIGGGDRLSTAEPAGAGKGRIRDGFNQQWDLGAGVNPNRTALPANNGAWPNLIRCDVLGTNSQSVDDPVNVRTYLQFGQTTPLNTAITVFLDADANPWNGTASAVAAMTDTGSGVGAVKTNLFAAGLDPAAVAPGEYFVAARVQGDGRTRWLYAPQRLTLTASRLPPALVPLTYTNGTMRLRLEGYPGQTIVTEASTNVAAWAGLATNVMPGLQLELLDSSAGLFPWRFYRARLAP